jgi:hypothetical protein
MTIPISGSDMDEFFEKHVEDEWKCCVNYLNRVRKETPYFYKRKEVMKRYWADRLKALALVVHKEKGGWKDKVSWLKNLEARYPSGIDWRYYLDEVQQM